MGRQDYYYETTTCNAGINEQAELARPHQCEDARNVWAPDGRLQKRPGYLGVAAPVNFTESAATSTIVISEPSTGNFLVSNDLSSLATGKRWYAGFNAPGGGFPAAPTGLRIDLTTTNSNNVVAKAEYWNGTQWQYIRIAEMTTNTILTSRHLNSSVSYITFPWPNDLASTTVNGSTRYFFRFTLQNAGSSSLDASVLVAGAPDISITQRNPTSFVAAYLFGAQFPSAKRYFVLNYSTSALIAYNMGVLRGPESNERVSLVASVQQDEPPSYAIVPEFSEAYATYNRLVTVHNALPSTSDDMQARVESDPALVGPGTSYDPAEIEQLSAWPRSKYILFYRGEMWAANLDDSGSYSVRWSAPQPYYKVWPGLNIETLMEDDNSPISGLAGFDENVILFKNDSIWRMVDTGTSDFGLQTYSPQRVVAGIGSVSNSSIQQIQGQLVFLAEDGIYGFTGAQARKLTIDPETGADRLKETIARIVPARRPFATAIHWKKHHLYMLAVAVDGSNVNNLVIAWDYKNDSWWLWDDIEVLSWLSDEDSADNQTLYFVDNGGRIYEFGVGQTDHGAAIDAYVTTHRIARSATTKRFRSVELTSTNDTRGATVELITNDEATGTSATLVLTDALEKEYGTSSSATTAVYNTDSYTPSRRRLRRAMFNKVGEWAQVEVSHSTKGTPLYFSDITVGMQPLGRRR